ncbi:MAG TPA: phosphatase PAP2 family protein [Micrococcales bacterium]|uniref:phosphatase PAP2 family protein n=1 Tax=Miniimonas arenae TaxID=676201 RepID=UPI000EDBD517|nr:phosphatase PAP2 family protein [Miniimonas arenae]HCX85909.1 phosphatase PAP2 family protein [Micrococcales bacterium]
MRRNLVLYGLLAVLLGLAIGVWVEAAGGGALPIDDVWAAWMLDIRVPVGETIARVLNDVGGGWLGVVVVPLVTIAVLLGLRRPWAALYYAVAAVSSVALVQGLKWLFDRARPEDMLVTSDAGSFPSGHVANAATIAVTLTVIAARAWVAWLGGVYVLLMVVSRAYLTVHWLSDTVAGALIGAGVALAIAAAFLPRLTAERERHRARAAVGS